MPQPLIAEFSRIQLRRRCSNPPCVKRPIRATLRTHPPATHGRASPGADARPYAGAARPLPLVVIRGRARTKKADQPPLAVAYRLARHLCRRRAPGRESEFERKEGREKRGRAAGAHGLRRTAATSIRLS